MGSVEKGDEPTVVEFGDEPPPSPAKETDTIVVVASPVQPETATSDTETKLDPVAAPAPVVAQPTREAQVNEEIRVDMKAFENFLLLQDQEWAELLHGLKNLERQSDRYSEEELRLIRQELFDDLERASQLKKDNKLMDEPGFRELYDYLKPLVDSAPGR